VDIVLIQPVKTLFLLLSTDCDTVSVFVLGMQDCDNEDYYTWQQYLMKIKNCLERDHQYCHNYNLIKINLYDTWKNAYLNTFCFKISRMITYICSSGLIYWQNKLPLQLETHRKYDNTGFVKKWCHKCNIRCCGHIKHVILFTRATGCLTFLGILCPPSSESKSWYLAAQGATTAQRKVSSITWRRYLTWRI
jgi:hypothetical protein